MICMWFLDMYCEGLASPEEGSWEIWGEGPTISGLVSITHLKETLLDDENQTRVSVLADCWGWISAMRYQKGISFISHE